MEGPSDGAHPLGSRLHADALTTREVLWLREDRSPHGQRTV